MMNSKYGAPLLHPSFCTLLDCAVTEVGHLAKDRPCMRMLSKKINGALVPRCGTAALLSTRIYAGAAKQEVQCEHPDRVSRANIQRSLLWCEGAALE